MIAALILVISLAALLQFFVSYCRSLIAASRGVELSDQTRDVAGIDLQKVPGREFQRLVQLARLCPTPTEEGGGIRAVAAYFRILGALGGFLGRLLPAAASWAEQERGGCAYFAAVVLDRRIAYSRDLMSEQLNNRL